MKIIDLGNGAEYEIHSNGNKYWYLNGKLHRADGPAIEYADGSKRWFLNGKLHRTDGPAHIEYGRKQFFLFGKRKVINKSYFINGTEYSEKEFDVIKEILWAV